MKTKLPINGTPQAKKFIKMFETCPDSQLKGMATKYGFSNIKYLKDSVRTRYSVSRGANDIPIEEMELPPIIMPKIKLKEFHPVTTQGDPEVQVLHLTDHHAGEITKSYNSKVFGFRLDQLFRSTLKITYLHRHMYPINELVIFMTGDMVHGENPFQGAKAGSIECGAQEQIFDISLPALTEFILSIKGEFLTVKIKCVPGNHGRYSKGAPDASNWDLILYKALQIALKPYGIDVEISNGFGLKTTVANHEFFLFHGHQVNASQGVPYFALVRAINSWYVTYGGFDYGVCGHFHKEDFLRVSAKAKLLMGASLVSDDPFALEIIKTSSIPCQWTFGVHERRGITWPYAMFPE